MTSQIDVALIRNLCGLLVSLAYLLTCYPWGFYKHSPADARSTGGEIECLHCTLYWIPEMHELLSED